MPSQPPSRSSSVHAPSRSSTPHLSPSSSKQEHTTTLSHKLLHMFDSAKAANFEATVTIHELRNVPQLSGQFSVDWKFRGRRPRGKDAHVSGGDKPSLPNLKLNQPLSTIHSSPSSSSLSTRTTSTASSPVISVNPASTRPVTALPRTKFSSLPPPRLDMGPARANSLRVESQPEAPRVEKKRSDPTPLRQATGPLSPKPEIASPEVTDEPLDASEWLLPGRDRKGSNETGSSGDSGVSPRLDSSSSSGSIPSFNLGPYRAPSAHPSNSHLTVPFSRSPARSGTSPSASTLVDHIPGKSHTPPPRPCVSRSSSAATPSSLMTISISTASTTSINSSLNPPRRHRTQSGLSTYTKTPTSTSGRKGSTPNRTLKAHTCTWDYEIHHLMRIPLGKPIATTPTPGSSTPVRPRGPAPVVGAGPLSESGLRLTIAQHPTMRAMEAENESTVHKDSVVSKIMTVRQARARPDGDGKANPSERGNSGAELEKTVFGAVDIDLAAFAGKGKLTRRFLLRGSRTNATIKLTVEMKWVGGEEKWAAPPMHEGHHVTGMHDLVGHETEDRLKGDLQLVRTPSSSSSASSLFSGRTHSNPSMASSLNLSRTHSDVSMVGTAPQIAYKSFEHHLRTPVVRSASDSSNRSPDQTPTPHTMPQFLSPPSPSPPSTLRHQTHRHHHHHSRHLRDLPSVRQFSSHELPAETVIEAVFNPHAATEESPFTFVPDRKDSLHDPSSILRNAFMAAELDGLPSKEESESPESVNGTDGRGVGGGIGKDAKTGWGGIIRTRKEKKEKERRQLQQLQQQQEHQPQHQPQHQHQHQHQQQKHQSAKALPA